MFYIFLLILCSGIAGGVDRGQPITNLFYIIPLLLIGIIKLHFDLKRDKYDDWVKFKDY